MTLLTYTRQHAVHETAEHGKAARQTRRYCRAEEAFLILYHYLVLPVRSGYKLPVDVAFVRHFNFYFISTSCVGRKTHLVIGVTSSVTDDNFTVLFIYLNLYLKCVQLRGVHVHRDILGEGCKWK